MFQVIPIRVFVYPANTHTHPHTHTQCDKVIAISAAMLRRRRG